MEKVAVVRVVRDSAVIGKTHLGDDIPSVDPRSDLHQASGPFFGARRLILLASSTGNRALW